MNKSRRKFSASFKAKVALEAVQERETIETLSKKYEVHPNQILSWKKELRENSDQVFASAGRSKTDPSAKLILVLCTKYEVDELYRQIGQLKVDNDWLKKKLQ
jgi:transposase